MRKFLRVVLSAMSKCRCSCGCSNQADSTMNYICLACYNGKHAS